MSDEDGWNEDRSYDGRAERLKAVEESGMQAVALAKDTAYRRGHLPMRDDGRQGRVSLICAHCGARASWEGGRLRGTLISEHGKCIGFEPKSRRQLEIEEIDAEEGWPMSAIAEANWATRASAAMVLSLSRRRP